MALVPRRSTRHHRRADRGGNSTTTEERPPRRTGCNLRGRGWCISFAGHPSWPRPHASNRVRGSLLLRRPADVHGGIETDRRMTRKGCQSRRADNRPSGPFVPDCPLGYRRATCALLHPFRASPAIGGRSPGNKLGARLGRAPRGPGLRVQCHLSTQTADAPTLQRDYCRTINRLPSAGRESIDKYGHYEAVVDQGTVSWMACAHDSRPSTRTQ